MESTKTMQHPRDLGVIATEKQVFLYSRLSHNADAFHMGASVDGLHFKSSQKNPTLHPHEKTAAIDTFRISHLYDKYILFSKHHDHEQTTLSVAESKDAISWQTIDSQLPFHETAMLAPDYTYNGSHVVYYGDTEIRSASTKDFRTWQKNKNVLLAPRHTHFDKHPLEVGSVITTPKGIVVIYFVRIRSRDGFHYSVGAALFDKKYPTRLLWRSDTPIWEQDTHWPGKVVYPMGAVHFKSRFILYFGIEGDGVHAVCFANLHDLLEGKGADSKPLLEKSASNPIITPVLKHMWESSATFNAAAVYEGGKVHFVYRAMGPENTSVLGYAASSDGVFIDERSDEPIYTPTEWFEYPGKYPSVAYMSGGGYGGCEDPRITKVDDVFYMTYVAYNGSDPPRIALTSIKVDDFLNKRWKQWAKPKLISKPGVVNKNCVIFPEKIDGKFVVIHRVFPNLLIDFVDDLFFDNRYLQGQYSIPPRTDSWDSRKLGAGAPPMKTKEGWLLIYQAVDDRDPGKYKIGAMLLDLTDPTRVLYRSNNPILEPTEWYENEGFKAGVAYPCGAVIMNEQLLVYYGGADTVICAASAPLDRFMRDLKKSSPAKKTEPALQKVHHFAYASAN